MEDLDFTRPAKSPVYDVAIARDFFGAAGTAASAAQGETVFVEHQQDSRMFFLLEGEVSLTRGRKLLDIVKQGEIFGEMATVTGHPRTASAVARTPCSLLSLDARQFHGAIRKAPEFALMLMSIMVNRLRLTVAMLTVTKSLPDGSGRGESRVFDQKLLGDLCRALPERCSVYHPVRKVIMKEGEAGVFMYVVVEGRAAITIQGRTVERVGPGGVFGEMALVDQSQRAASAVAETDCSLLAINRNDFLALVKTKPEFGMYLLKAVAERLRYLTSFQK
ncbi:MAG: cyclic nucleotide-binding domain-containing protein [Betaproteobacteria bacterium]|nr:cyclic nucleotide-binding domain-containing protein [Betaproteobacteria bacterium]